MQNVNLLTIFLTGLLTGGLTCMAVQGGLLATTIAQREEKKLREDARNTGTILPIVSFLAAKLIAYTALGFLLGSFGSLFQLSLTVQFFMQLAVALFMIGTALNMLDLHPIFRYFVIQPPHFLTKLIRKQSKSNDLFAPVLLGFFTICIPCGTTQAMMALAIGSGNPWLGAAILFSFVIGTAPVFFLLGYFTSKLSGSMQGTFMKFASILILILALFNLNNALALVGEGIPLGGPTILGIQDQSGNVAQTEATINIESVGYSPNYIVLKSNSHVTLNLVNKNSYTCASAFTIPSLGIQKIVSAGTSAKIEFDTPSQPTTITFMCSMGMYKGYIKVV